MGTNYYTILNQCKECKCGKNIHLGKSSFGWTFSFQYNDGEYYENAKQMKNWLKDKEIKDEYGEVISNKLFWGMIKAKKDKFNLSHAEAVDDSSSFMIDGDSFSNGEFS